MTALLSRRSRYLLALAATFFFLQILFRLFFWGLLSEQPMAWESTLLQAFWVGLRFDLRIGLLIALTTLPWLLLPRFSAVHSHLLRRVLKYWVSFLVFALLVVYALDAGHYAYLGKRLDAAIIRFFSDAEIAGGMLWQSYPIIQIALAIATLWVLLHWFHQRFLLTLLTGPQVARKWYLNTLQVLVLGVVIVFLLLGHWSLTPLRWNHAHFVDDAEITALGLNPVLWVYDTAGIEVKVIAENDLAQHFETLSTLLGSPFPSQQGAALDRWVEPVNPVVSRAAPPPNLVIVFMESLGSTHIGAYGNPLNPTPNIDAMIAQSRWYPNFNVSARSSARSVFTSITGIPDISAIKTATRNPYIVQQRTIINAFTQHQKYYLIGGSAGWANMSALVNHSITGVKLLDERDWQSRREDIWGISDLSLMREASTLLSQSEKPFFAYIQTAANHDPFTIATDNAGFEVRELEDTELARGGFKSIEQFNAVRFLDHNIGQMLHLFKDRGIYDNTIFVFFADHQGRTQKVPYLPSYTYRFGIAELLVPLIIHGPNFIAAERDPTYGSLPDLLPTVAGLFPKPYLNTTLGRDLAWAKGRDLPAYGITTANRASIAFNGRQIARINHLSGKIESADISAEGEVTMTETNQMAAAAQAYYTAAQYLFTANLAKHEETPLLRAID